MPHRREPPLAPQTILWLQSTVGNRAVQRLLARRAKEQAKQEILVIVDENQELEIAPPPMPPVTLDHWTWWRLLLRFLLKKWKRQAQDKRID